MKWFYNLKISAKLLTGFVVIALIAGVVGVFGIVRLITIDNNYSAMYENNTKPLGNLAIVGMQFQRTRIYVRNVVLDNGNAKEYIDNIEEFNKIISENIEAYKNGVSSKEEQNELDTLLVLLDKVKPGREKVISLASAGQIEEAYKVLIQEADPVAVAADEQINVMLDLNIDEGALTSQENTAQANSSVILMIAIVVIAVIISIGLGLFIARIISNPVKQMAQAADRLALGDVNVNVESNTKDEIGSLAKSFSAMIENIRAQAMAVEKIAAGDLTVDVEIKSDKDLLGKKLSELVRNNNEILLNISSASEQVAAGSKQVSDSSMVLSQGATEQASSIEQLTASIEEISSQTNLNAQNANQANELAESAKVNAVQGNSQMKEMLNAMEEINNASSSISKIIKVIDEIAFQTNILALNAAVEAARAGQHGKGFAVVAEEVRNLAARSAKAAKETTDMIEGSIKKTEGGTRIAKETAEALNKIVDGIEKVATLVNNIAVASSEQASGIGQINQGVMQVSQVVQANSATSEEGAAASEELSSQAALLKEMVSKFRLKQNVKSYSSADELSPEIMKMLEGMAEKNRIGLDHVEKLHKEVAATKHTIALSDKEFGKY